MIVRTYKVVYSPLAEQDLREAWRHFAQHDLRVADRFLDAISRRTDALREFPERGAARGELGRGLRMLIEGKYLIFYRISRNTVRVERVLYGSKELSRLII